MKGVTIFCMELIRISKRKLKIMLTPTDMCHFELNADSFGEDSQQMHHAFRLLLEEIKKQTDFDADDHHISVQYFPSREGGCEMFISRIPSTEGESSNEGNRRATSATRSLQPHPAVQGGFRRDCAYRFANLEHLLQVCRRLQGAGYIGESTAYRDEKGAYFLLFTVLSSSPFSMPEQWDFIAEYGTVENAALLRLYILEHGRVICSRDAVERLASLA